MEYFHETKCCLDKVISAMTNLIGLMAIIKDETVAGIETQQQSHGN